MSVCVLSGAINEDDNIPRLALRRAILVALTVRAARGREAGLGGPAEHALGIGRYTTLKARGSGVRSPMRVGLRIFISVTSHPCCAEATTTQTRLCVPSQPIFFFFFRTRESTSDLFFTESK